MTLIYNSFVTDITYFMAIQALIVNYTLIFIINSTELLCTAVCLYLQSPQTNSPHFIDIYKRQGFEM